MIDLDELRIELTDRLPKSMHRKIEDIINAVDLLDQDEPGCFEVVGAHIATEHVEYPNATVHVDASGNFVGVDLAEGEAFA